MQLVRPTFAPHPGRFGRAPLRQLSERTPAVQRPWFGDDLRLFATTFLVGFVFVSVLIA